MKVLKWFLLIIGVIIAGLLIIALFLPPQMRMTVETVIDRPHQMVFNDVASFRNRIKWDPWLETEPSARTEFKSTDNFVGSTYKWSGDKLSFGEMIVDSVVYGKYILSSLMFEGKDEGFKAEWNFSEESGKTKVMWTFKGEAVYPIGRIMAPLMKGTMMESLNRGLGNLKKLMEETPVSLSRLGTISQQQFPAVNTMIVDVACNMKDKDLVKKVMEESFGLLVGEVQKQGLQMTGMPFSMYYEYNPETGDAKFYCGVVVNELGEKTGKVMPKAFEAMKALQAIHYGPYEEMEGSYVRMMQYIENEKVKVENIVWDFYKTDPGVVTDPAQWETIIAFKLADK
ncbi:hypothetical protein EYV94_06780 [Puteibacter caeruleilacunae]|nr:hypothetical protein EYV94_06780 [Puteibacter caeruleilacunae]